MATRTMRAIRGQVPMRVEGVVFHHPKPRVRPCLLRYVRCNLIPVYSRCQQQCIHQEWCRASVHILFFTPGGRGIFFFVTLPCKGNRTSLGYDPIDGQFKALTHPEDVKKGVWSKQTFDLSYDLVNMTSPGTNKAGEIIFAPTKLSHCAQPFYIFHYNTQKKDLRRVRIHGIADDEGFRRHYGLCWKLNAILEGMNSRTCLLNPLAV
ncbi:hypothetical protein F2Q68_00034934, partial [Brassica cretica]